MCTYEYNPDKNKCLCTLCSRKPPTVTSREELEYLRKDQRYKRDAIAYYRRQGLKLQALSLFLLTLNVVQYITR